MSERDEGVDVAARHALGWLVFGNAVGLLMAVLLLRPSWNPGEWTYGRWVPVHLNVQLYGWLSLPLVACLLRGFEVGRSRVGGWVGAVVWGWTAALGAGVWSWLGVQTSGKIFLDWKGGALTAFMIAQGLLWLVLVLAWVDRRGGWSRVRQVVSLMTLAGLAMVPVALWFTSSPELYPPVDRTTGGPTGASLLGSTLVVVGMMLALPRVMGLRGGGWSGRGVWWFYGISWVVFGVSEGIGGTHFDFLQIGALCFLVPWTWILPKDWDAFEWPAGALPWRWASLGWWGVLVLSGCLLYLPEVLDRMKFTQGLVAHSHLAMAGFTTSFCALLLIILTGKRVGGRVSVGLWHVAALVMVVVLADAGWREGGGGSWMVDQPMWRTLGWVVRAVCGGVMLMVSSMWCFQQRSS
jgi:cytochrome c oxidase cbb3-type subunit 1